MGITAFEVNFVHNGKHYTFDASTITRNLVDGGGNPILSVEVHDDDGHLGICNLTPDWRIASLIMK